MLSIHKLESEGEEEIKVMEEETGEGIGEKEVAKEDQE
jgi:hypothetical protein